MEKLNQTFFQLSLFYYVVISVIEAEGWGIFFVKLCSNVVLIDYVAYCLSFYQLVSINLVYEYPYK